MIHAQHLKTIPSNIPLFLNCFRAYPYSQPNSTSYLLLHHQQADQEIYTQKSNKYICASFQNEATNCCFIVMQGDCLEEYVQQKVKLNSYPILTEQEIWSLVTSMCGAFQFLKQNGCAQKLTHFKQYCIRKIANKKIYKLIYHQSMVRQLDAAEAGTPRWDKFYLSPEQLDGQFIPQKSIVFSFGLLLLDLCAGQIRGKSFYRSQHQIDEQVIKTKIHISSSKYGYSNLLCNFIKECLVISHQNRPNFEQLNKMASRKMQRQYMRKSELMSQLSSIQGAKSIKYEIILPADYKNNINFNSSQNYQDQHVSQFVHYEEEDKEKEDQIQKQIQKLENSSVEHFKGSQGASIETKKLKKKSSVKKFQGSKVTKNKSNNIKQSESEIKQQKQSNQQLDNTQLNNNIQYRGTFGARTVTSAELEKNSSKRIKSVTKNQPIQSEQQTHNPKAPDKKQKIQSKEQPKNQQHKIYKKQLNISITFNNQKEPDDIYRQESKNHSQVETPKGFGKFSFHRQSEIDNNNLSAQNESDMQHEIQNIPELISEMESLNLKQCLQPVENIIQRLKKIGVWVQGDLYYGDFVNGRRNGLGLQIFANNEYYYGYFKEDLFSGEGLYFWNKKQYFFGKFELGQKIWGRLQGQVQYQGFFKDNKRHGIGVCWYPTLQIYSGSWFNGKRNGFGILLEPEGQKFVGYWIKGKKKGEGYLQTDSMRISGFWNDEVIQGETLIQYRNGDVFKGKTSPTLEKLSGQYKSKSGRVFRGQFENDCAKKGELIYSNGDRYIGQLVNHKRHGYGQYYYASGEVYKGEWQNNTKKT